MSRTLRGVWTRRRQLAPVAALATALVASNTLVLSHARSAGDPALVAPLVLLGGVALVAPARAEAHDRRDETALARLRGVGGGRLVAGLLAAPFLVLLVGGVVGLAVAAAFVPLTGSGLLVLVGTVGYATAVTAVALAAGLREPLSEQVSRVARPRAAATTATFAGILALVAAGYAVFAAAQTPAGPRWLVDASPALVGLAVGQLLVWLLQGTARLVVARTASAPAAPFLAVRRLARRAGALAPLRLLVAAAVTATVAATAAGSAHAWVDQAAGLRTAAPVQVRLPGASAAQALLLSHRLDPRGRWLEAAVVLPRGEDNGRTVLVDTARYDRVSAPLLRGTGAAPVAAGVAGLAWGTRAVARGDTAALDGRVTGRAPRRVLVHVDYVTDQNYVATRTLAATPAADGTITATVRVPGCAHGCVPTAVTFDGAGSLALHRLDFAGRDLRLACGLTSAIALPGPGTTGSTPVRPTEATAPVPVLATSAARLVQGPDGNERPASTRSTVAALPLVGTRGTLADLGRALAGALPTSPSATVLVLARADTPGAVLAGLPGKRITLQQMHAQVSATSHAGRAGAALLAGLCCLLVASLALLSGVARRRRELAHEVAALRVVGVSLGGTRRSTRVELGLCGLATTAAVLAGSWLGIALLLGRLPLLAVPADAPVPDTGLRPLLLVAGALVGLVLVVVVVGLGRTVPEVSTRPGLLREGEVR